MANLLDLLNSDLGKQIINNISNNTGVGEQKTTEVIGMGLPTLINAMQNNAASADGASGLLGALLGGKHNGSILDNLSGFINGGDFSDGAKILGHVLGNNQSTVENSISQKTGVSSSNITKILMMLAPIVMGYLGKQAQNNNVSNSSDLGGLLGGLLGGNSNSGGSFGGSILTVLDQNNDGKLDVSDAISAVTKKSSGGIGGLLGKLFGK